MTRHRLMLRRHDGTPLTVLDNIIEWELVRVANDIGWWSCTLDARFDTRLLYNDNIMEFWRQPTGASETLLGVGFMRYWEWNTDLEGTTQLRIGGPDAIELLNRRNVQNKANSIYSSKSGKADDVIKEIVDEQYLSTSNRVGDLYYSRSSALPAAHFSIAPDTSEGEDVEYQFAFRKVLPVLQQLAADSWRKGIAVYFDLEYPAPGVFLLQTWANIRGIDRRIGSGEPIIFSQEAGNISEPLLRFDYTEEINFVVGGGSGTDDDRTLDPENDEVRSQQSIWNRREEFQDARECGTTLLCIASRAFSRMQAGRPVVSFEGDLVDTPTHRFGIDWGYGDYVTVQYFGIELNGRVNQFQVNMDSDGLETVRARVSITEAISGSPD